MRKTILACMLVLIAACMVNAKDFELIKKQGPYTVLIKMDKNPPSMGNNAINISVKDAVGKAVKDAKVVVDYEMPAMPGMPAMRYNAEARLKGETYAGVLNFSMGGSWTINIRIIRSGKIEKIKFNVDVS